LLELDDPDWIIHTKSEERPPVKLDLQAKVQRSLVANGCVIRGYVKNSILFPGVVIEPDAIVKDSIIMNNSLIGRHAVIDRTIIDKHVFVGEHCHIGHGDIKHSPNSGISIIGKMAQIPKSTKIGRGCIIESNVRETEFHINNLEPGTIIHHQ
ncbi:MAG: glucose-1-phosphate adenylyltransferase, partial [bacterium]